LNLNQDIKWTSDALDVASVEDTIVGNVVMLIKNVNADIQDGKKGLISVREQPLVFVFNDGYH